MFDRRWDEGDWRNECDQAERRERQQHASDQAAYYAETPAHSEMPAIMQDDAGPIGMSCEDVIEQARRRAPETDYRQMAIDFLKDVA